MIIRVKGRKCQWEGCDKDAECIAGFSSEYSNNHRSHVGVYCLEHGPGVADKKFPEYIVDCPNCGCIFGV